MEKPLFILKPSKFNGLFPRYLMLLFYLLFIIGPAYILFYVFKESLDIGGLQYLGINAMFIGVYLLLPSLILLPRLIKYHFTRYKFYGHHIITEFKFFIIRHKSVSYHNIVNVTADSSFWDRLCHSSDIILYTAEDHMPDLTLYDVPNSAKLVDWIYERIDEVAETHMTPPRKKKIIRHASFMPRPKK